MQLLTRALLLAALTGFAKPPSNAPPSAADELARLAPFVGSWRCVVHHAAGDETRAHDVRQKLDIRFDADAKRYDVAFSPEPGERDAVTSLLHWTYDAHGRRFVYEGSFGEGRASASETYFSRGPEKNRLVWNGEFRGAIVAPMRVTYAQGANALELTTEARADGAWKTLATASCTH